MNHGRTQKVTSRHLERDAYLYVRQSTMRQVLENTESTQRQYALRERAVALGWPLDRITVIDQDLGRSAASAVVSAMPLPVTAIPAIPMERENPR